MSEEDAKKMFQGLITVKEIRIPLKDVARQRANQIALSIEPENLVHFVSERDERMNWDYDEHEVREIDGQPWLILRTSKPNAWR